MASQHSALFTAATEARAKGILALILNGARQLRMMIAELRNRDSLFALLALEDWHLRDLGVQREDVIAALELPLSESASQALERMRERRAQG